MIVIRCGQLAGVELQDPSIGGVLHARETREKVFFFSTMRTLVVTMGAIGPSRPSAFREAPAGLSLSSQWVRLKLSMSTQWSMLQSYQAVFFGAEIASS